MVWLASLFYGMAMEYLAYISYQSTLSPFKQTRLAGDGTTEPDAVL
jgi:hypothetical protein